ncbi:MAG: TatD family hydrolase [Clostridia bacterium]|nr:TatD family hydrolase [Clostridia bacterium]
MFFDTHAHYNSGKFKFDRDEAVKKAFQSGITNILNVSYDIPSLEASVSLAKKYDFIYASVGIHPHSAKDMSEELLNKVGEYAKKPKVVAIGEIGLDYNRNFSPVEVQKLWFRRQIDLAKSVKLPVIIHSRDAYKDTLEVLTGEDAKSVGGIIHSFSGNREMAREFLNQEFYISISGPITYKNAKELADAVKYAPMDRLLIETDCPYLTPEPFRGKRNESVFVRLVAEKIAEIKGETLEEIARITTENGKRLLKID